MRIDLNADLGESFGTWVLGDDAAMLDVVTSANVACGFHAGDPLTLRETVELAAVRGVRIGAQVGYRDLAGFGRRFIDVDVDELAADVLYQLGALDGLARVAGTRVSYVKPHGALYHAVGQHEGQAWALVAAVRDYSRAVRDDSRIDRAESADRADRADGDAHPPEGPLPLLHQAGSLVEEVAAEHGIPVVAEAFADRGYLPDGRLVPRGEEGDLLHDPQEVAERMVRLVREGVVRAVDGSDVPVQVESICTHGDSPGAVAMARAVRAALLEAGAELAPFARR